MTGRMEDFVAATSQEGDGRGGRGACLELENELNSMICGSCRAVINVQMLPSRVVKVL